MTPDEARALTGSWIIHLEAERKSPHTIRTYTAGMEAYVKWCEEGGRKVGLEPQPVKEFTAALLGSGREAATAMARLRGVRRFSAWYAEETGDPDRIAGVRPPKLDKKIMAAVTPDQLAALQATCRTRSFFDIRDRAIISVMADSMVRSEELLSMTVRGTDVRQRTALIDRGKGGKGRVVAYSAQAARDLDRYLRARALHRLAAEPWLWLPVKRSGAPRLSYGALYGSLKNRARHADPPFALSPHMLRRGGAIAWRRKGGSVTSLMALGGWTDISMVQRYVRAAETEIALEEARRLFDGEVL
jgi:integrase/recombinase XerD